MSDAADDSFEDIEYVEMSERAKLSQALFAALYAEHYSPVLMICEGKGLNKVFALARSIYEQSEINIQDTFVLASRNGADHGLKRLHTTGEYSDASLIADCFQEDNYLGSDIRSAIMSPDDPECVDPKKLFYIATYLLRFFRPIVSDTDWCSTEAMCELLMAGNNAGNLAYVDNPEQSRLTTLINLQTIAVGFPDLARILESEGHKNLAFLAHGLGRKAYAVKEDLVLKAEQQLQQANDQIMNIFKPS